MKGEKIVTLRKRTIIFVIALIGSIVFIILFNLKQSANKSDTSSKPKFVNVEVVANSNDIKWVEQKILHTDNKKNTTENVNKQAGKTDTAEDVATLNNLSIQHEVKLTQEEIAKRDEEIADMRAPLTQNQLTADLTSSNQQSGSKVIENKGEKKVVLKHDKPSDQKKYSSQLEDPVSPYEIKAGTVIPGLLLKGINSELPNEITGQIASNVYDTVSGNYILIPQGTKVMGTYSSQINYGQSRIHIVWNRLLFPNGKSMPLDAMNGEDLSGYAGLKDKVDNHYVKIFGSALLMSVLSAGAQLSQPENNQNPFTAPSVNQTIAQSVGLQLANTGIALTNKNLNIPPTLIIRPGMEFNISVKHDLIFPGPYSDFVERDYE